MVLISRVIDIILNLDKYLGIIIDKFGIFTYLLLFLIIFAETGLIITPFLPGDSLLFVAGTFAAVGYFNILILFILICVAAILGDTVNYWMGKYIGGKVAKSKFVKQEYIDKTNKFYEKHGSKTIILARFVPIIRTFAPFIAGVGKMQYSKFLIYNIIGGILWTGIFLFGGYFFGNIPVVKNNLTIVIFIIIILSFVPMAAEAYRHYRKK